MTDLDILARKHGTDKSGHHDYCRHYHKHFKHLRNDRIKLLELGVGGYKYPDRGGEGLKMWSEYFPIAEVYGIDLYDKSEIKGLSKRVKIFTGSQADGDFLLEVMSQIGNPDIIIDDASHVNILTIKSFLHLFPWVKPGGIYVIEDIESSWWNEHGFGGDPDVDNHQAITAMNFIKDKLLLDVNAKHVPKYKATYQIESMHFYQNMVVIQKK